MTRNMSHATRRTVLGLIGASLICPARGLADPLASISGSAFGTTWRIVGPRQAALEAIRADIDALFDGIDRRMSPWRSDSTISRINAAPAGWQMADEDLVALTDSALGLAKRSAGAFDPTVGPLVARWGFGPIEGGAAPDWRGLSTGRECIGKARGDLTLDLCGIAKGWALDRAAEIAVSAGLDQVLLDLGGEFTALGRHPAGRSWQIAIEHPIPGLTAPARLRLRAGRAVATSGLRTQSYTIGSRVYGHIIDPAKRAPTDDALRSVTVLAADATTADGWATALFAAGETAGPA